MNARARRQNDSPPRASMPGSPAHEPAIVQFPAGIPGFESCRRFILVATPELTPLGCLQALDPPEPSFLTIDPRSLDPGYDCELREFERARLGATDEPLVWLAIVTASGRRATANLRAPVVISPQRMVGCQFIRDDHDYPIHFPVGRE